MGGVCFRLKYVKSLMISDLCDLWLLQTRGIFLESVKRLLSKVIDCQIIARS